MNRPPLFYANEFEKYLVFSKITPDGDYEYKYYDIFVIEDDEENEE